VDFRNRSEVRQIFAEVLAVQPMRQVVQQLLAVVVVAVVGVR
jgi:hypothetical protein